MYKCRQIMLVHDYGNATVAFYDDDDDDVDFLTQLLDHVKDYTPIEL